MNKLILAILLSVPAFGAVTPATIWEMRFTGTATSGGGFDSTIASAGTDMSIFDNKNATSCTSCQSATVNISTTDAVATTTAVTSATANFSVALIGNTIYLTGGGATTGWYQVTAVGSATAITVSPSTGGAGAGSTTMNIGGAVGGGSAGALAVLEIATTGIQPGNTVYVKSGGWVAGSTTATNTYSIAGSAGNPITYIGYTTTRGDGGMVVVPTSTATIAIMTVSATTRRFVNFKAQRTGGATVKGWSISGANFIGYNIASLDTTSTGFEFATGSVNAQCFNCWAKGATGTAGVQVTGTTGGNGALFYAFVSEGGTVTGFDFASNGSNNARTTCIYCISANNTPTVSGFTVSNINPVSLIHSIAYGNGGAGVLLSAANGSFMALNSVFSGNGTYGVSSTSVNYITSGTLQLLMDYNAYGQNGTAPRNQLPAGANDRTLSGDPFTNGAAMDFSLDVSGIADLRGLGFPGILQSGGTGNVTPGALMPPYSGGATAGQKGYVFIN